MTNANDLLWWDDGDDCCRLTFATCAAGVMSTILGWRWRYHIDGIGASEHGYAPTREAAMQAAVDDAEAVGVDFGKAPRWKYSEFIFLNLCAIVHLSGEWCVRDTTSSVRSRLASGQSSTESLARTAAIAALRVEVQKLVEKAKGELGL